MDFYKANVARCAAYVAMYLNANNFGEFWPETIVSINSGVLRYVRDPVKCMQCKRRDLAVGGSRVPRLIHEGDWMHRTGDGCAWSTLRMDRALYVVI